MSRKITALGIDTSCDDTSIGVYQYNMNEFKVISDIRESHGCKDGVIPEVSARKHVDLIDNVLERAIINMNDIDIIAATAGPGLIPCLISGYYFGMHLAKRYNKIFIPVHHIEAHLSIIKTEFKVEYPFLCLLISGGHTEIVAAYNFNQYQIIAKTLDDACGEVIDKVGRELNLHFPAGAEMEILALANKTNKFLNIPMKGKLAFSFSGLKTEFMQYLDNIYLPSIVENTIAETLHEKIQLAIKHTGINQVLVGGGVASNQTIRNKLSYCTFAPIKLCTDNGVMVASTGILHYLNDSKFINNFNIDIFNNIKIDAFYNIF